MEGVVKQKPGLDNHARAMYNINIKGRCRVSGSAPLDRASYYASRPERTGRLARFWRKIEKDEQRNKYTYCKAQSLVPHKLTPFLRAASSSGELAEPPICDNV